jgi:hypothetical protein
VILRPIVVRTMLPSHPGKCPEVGSLAPFSERCPFGHVPWYCHNHWGSVALTDYRTRASHFGSNTRFTGPLRVCRTPRQGSVRDVHRVRVRCVLAGGSGSGVPSAHDAGSPVLFQTPHRPKPGLQATVVNLDCVVGVLRGVVKCERKSSVIAPAKPASDQWSLQSACREHRWSPRRSVWQPSCRTSWKRKRR